MLSDDNEECEPHDEESELSEDEEVSWGTFDVLNVFVWHYLGVCRSQMCRNLAHMENRLMLSIKQLYSHLEAMETRGKR